MNEKEKDLATDKFLQGVVNLLNADWNLDHTTVKVYGKTYEVFHEHGSSYKVWFGGENYVLMFAQ